MREIQDATLQAAVALPNAANTVNTAAIDLGNATPFPVTERIGVRLKTTQSTGANSLNINFVFQHSNDSNTSNFTNIPELAKRTLAGNAANYPAVTYDFMLPQGARRFIRAQATGEANGGNAADGTMTLVLLF